MLKSSLKAFKKFMFKYLKEVRGELMRVTWPSKAEVFKLTLLVIVISVVVSIYLGSLDLGFTKLLEIVINKK